MVVFLKKIYYNQDMKIVYMRHANRDYSVGTSQKNPITANGKKMAKLLGEMMKELPVQTIYCGEYLRYEQTAELVNKHIKAPIVKDKRINEWLSKEESRESLQKRTHEFLKEIIAKHGNEDMIFCVTSGANINEWLTFFNDYKPNEKFFMQLGDISPIIFHYKKG